MVTRYLDRKSAVRVRGRERSRRGWLAALRTLSAVLAVAALAFAVRHFRLHTVRSVSVEGYAPLAGEAEKALAPCVGKAMWNAGGGAATRELLKRHPVLKGAEAVPLPWGVLRVRLTARVPVASLEREGNAVIDAEGVAFRLPEGEAPGLPVLSLDGSSEAGRRRAITAILTSGGPDPSWVVDCSDEDDIVLKLPGPTAVHLGNGRFPEKWGRLREILRLRGTEGTPGSIDLRFHDQAVVRRQV